MSALSIADWLKNSIPGLLVLGALGSILAVWVFRIVRFTLKVISRGRQVYFNREFRRGQDAGMVFSHLVVKKDAIMAMTWAAFRIARLLIALAAFLGSLIVLLYLLQLTSGSVLTFGTFIAVLTSFLFLRWAFEEYQELRASYRALVAPIITTIREKVDASEEDDLENNDD